MVRPSFIKMGRLDTAGLAVYCRDSAHRYLQQSVDE